MTPLEAEKTLKALSSYYRISMIRAMHEEDRKVGDLAKSLMIDQATATYHMKVLKELGIVEPDGTKQKRMFSLDKEELTRLLGKINSFLLEQ